MPGFFRLVRAGSKRLQTGANLLLFSMILNSFAAPALLSHSQQKKKLPKARQLDKDITWTRDDATSELKASSVGDRNATDAGAPGAGPHISGRSFVRLVPVTCAVSGADGAPLRGLNSKDFRVFDDGNEKAISFFDEPAAHVAGVALVIDASPSVLRDAKEMTDAARALMEMLSRGDEVAVMNFSAHTYLQIGFSSDRNLLSRAIARVDVRSLLRDVGGSNIYEAVYLTAQEVFAKSAHHERNAIVLFTDGQDSGLGLTLDPASATAAGASGRLTYEDVIRALTAANIQVFAISTENRPKIMTAQWLEAHRGSTLVTADARKSGIPPYTLYLAELARASGGEIYFLHEASSLADTFQRIGAHINAEYWIGFVPDSAEGVAPHAGWHSLRVEIVGHDGATAEYRPAYFVSAGAQ